MLVQITITQKYGRELIYPVNDAAKALAFIAGTRTLHPEAIRLAQTTLGHTIEIVPDDATTAMTRKLTGVAP